MPIPGPFHFSHYYLNDEHSDLIAMWLTALSMDFLKSNEEEDLPYAQADIPHILLNSL